MQCAIETFRNALISTTGEDAPIASIELSCMAMDRLRLECAKGAVYTQNSLLDAERITFMGIEVTDSKGESK